MKQKWSILILVAVFVLVIGGAGLLYRDLAGGATPGLAVEGGGSSQAADAGGSASAAQESSSAPDATEAPRVEAPDFTIYDADGGEVQLSGFEGKPVILNFWASWCGPCKSEMPDFEDAFAQYGEEIHFVMVNATYGRETMDSAQQYLQDGGYTFPVYYDTEMDAAATFGVSAFPTTFFIDADGYLVAYGQGAMDAEVLQTGIDMILPEDG